MSHRRRVHLHNVDGRTLCDLHADTALTSAEGEDIPPCGACVLIAEDMMAQVVRLILGYGEPWPSPLDAVDELRVGRWGSRLDLADLAGEIERDNYRYPQRGGASIPIKEKQS